MPLWGAGTGAGGEVKPTWLTEGSKVNNIDLCAASEKGWVLDQPYSTNDEVLVCIKDLSTKLGTSNVVYINPIAGNYDTDEFLDVEVYFNEIMDTMDATTISLTLDSGTVTANYYAGNGTDKITYRYEVLVTDSAAIGGTNKGIAVPTLAPTYTMTTYDFSRNIGENSAFPLKYLECTVNEATNASVSLVSSAQVGDLRIAKGDNLVLSVKFDRGIKTVTGTPKIAVYKTNGSTKIGDAVYSGQSAIDTLTFTMVVPSTVENYGIKVGANITLGSGGSIKGYNGVAAAVTFTQKQLPITMNSVLIGSVSAVTITDADRKFATNAVVPVKVAFTKQVGSVAATPKVKIYAFDGTTPVGDAVYSEADSTADYLIFNYTVLVGDDVQNGIKLGANVTLGAGGSIKDVQGDEMVVTFAQVTTDVALNWVQGAVSLTELEGAPAAKFVTGETVPVRVTFTHNISAVEGTPVVKLFANDGTTPIGDAVYSEEDSGIDYAVFNYTALVTDDEQVDIMYGANVTLGAGGHIKDVQGSDMLVAFAQGHSYATINWVAATVATAVIDSVDTDFTTAEVIPVKVTFSKDVAVTGAPYVTIFANDGTTPIGNAAYSAADSADDVVVFKYTVLVTDSEQTAFKFGANVILNSGTITDLHGDNATVTFAQATATATTINKV